MKWSVAVTTCENRRATFLPRTLKSLAAAGFTDPHLHCDGISAKFVLPLDVSRRQANRATLRNPSVGAIGSWFLTLWQLWLTDSQADYYAVFQDDIVLCHNVREYLENSIGSPTLVGEGLPDDGYYNLYTDVANHNLLGTYNRPSRDYQGWYSSDQTGRGALALVFPRSAVPSILSWKKWLYLDTTASIDGMVSTALRMAHYTEYVHNPSLVQHVGNPSLINHLFTQSPCFLGEDQDALQIR